MKDDKTTVKKGTTRNRKSTEEKRRKLVETEREIKQLRWITLGIIVVFLTFSYIGFKYGEQTFLDEDLLALKMMR